MPEERKFCERFIESIYCNDPTLLTALANARKDDAGSEGIMNNFAKMLAYLIVNCPVSRSRKRTSDNNIQAQVSALAKRDEQIRKTLIRKSRELYLKLC